MSDLAKLALSEVCDTVVPLPFSKLRIRPWLEGTRTDLDPSSLDLERLCLLLLDLGTGCNRVATSCL